LGFLRPIQFPIKPTGGFLAVQRGHPPLLDKGLTDPVNRRGATFHGFRNAIIVPTRPLGPHIRFQQNPRMKQGRCGPVRPGVDQRFQIRARFSGQTNNVFREGHDPASPFVVPYSKTDSLYKVKSDRLKH
jgi:hypothetical protein